MVATPTTEGLLAMRHRDVRDAGGEKIGELVEVYLDKATREPEWLAVDAGLFGMKRVLVPAVGATIEPGAVRVAFSKDAILHTPDVMDEQISQDVEQRLYEHYGLRYSFDRSPTGLPESERTARSASSDAEDARWPDVPEPIDERPVFARDLPPGTTRHAVDAGSPSEQALGTARRNVAETALFVAAIAGFASSLLTWKLVGRRRTLDLRIAGALLLAASVATKQSRMLAERRRESLEHPVAAPSIAERIKGALNRS